MKSSKKRHNSLHDPTKTTEQQNIRHQSQIFYTNIWCLIHFLQVFCQNSALNKRIRYFHFILFFCKKQLKSHFSASFQMVIDRWKAKKLADQQIIASNHHWCLILQIALQDACCDHIRICKDPINSMIFKKDTCLFSFLCIYAIPKNK